MRDEDLAIVARAVRVRLDVPESEAESEPESEPPPWRAPLILVALAAGFVLVGASGLELGSEEGRLGLAVGEAIGPLGQAFGGWDASLWPGRVLPAQLWALTEDWPPMASSVRWPSAIAAVVLGLLVCRRASARLGPRTGILTGFALFGSLALIDRSAGGDLDLMMGLAVVAALDRILGRGADWVAGFWAALAFLSGGWPPLALIALVTVILGRRGATLSPKLLVPPLIAFVGWSIWVLVEARAEVWGAALAWPLTQAPDWGLAGWVLAFGLPWSPFAVLCAWPTVRRAWPAEGRSLVLGWLQVAAVATLAGSLVPGLAAAARLPALVGLAVGASAAWARAWSADEWPKAARWVLMTLTIILAAAWLLIAAPRGCYLVAAVGFYRSVAILALVLAGGALILAATAAISGNRRLALIAVVGIALGLKVVYAGIYAPEWNYRFGQGPWGRALGQWVPPRWPIYVFHPWPADLAFATGHPFRQLTDPGALRPLNRGVPQFVLLQPSEFAHWPDDAPTIVPVRAFEDERGESRILARTEGVVNLRHAAVEPD